MGRERNPLLGVHKSSTQAVASVLKTQAKSTVKKQNRKSCRSDQYFPQNFLAQPHMLRHACGDALASKGHGVRARQAYLGHRDTVRCIEFSAGKPTSTVQAATAGHRFLSWLKSLY
jgi:hypothetical protein